MEGNGYDPLTGDQYQSDPDSQSDRESPAFSSNLYLDHVGHVILTHNSDGLSWKLVDPIETARSNCLGTKPFPKVPSAIKFSDVYAAESIAFGLVHESNIPNDGMCLLAPKTLDSEMHRFTVHSFQRSKSQPCLWVLAVYIFGHKDLQTCQMWVNRINASLSMEVGRPRNVLVFVHPRSGKGNGCRTWESVAPIFLRAKVKTKVIVTERAGHAFSVMASTTTKELFSYDGVVAVGGDGFFNEILNGLLLSRHKAPYPPAPADFVQSVCNPNEMHADNSYRTGDESPLLSSSGNYDSGNEDGVCSTNQDPKFPLLNGQFKLGLIPSGSTDAIVICTTGTRDPTTSALHIVLGKRVCLDIAHIVRWKETPTSKIEPCVRYAASFAGYGFYGDVITESEKFRWMGPKRYDYSGTKVFLKHRSYDAEVSYLEDESEKTNSTPQKGHLGSKLQALWGPKSEKLICRVNCSICNTNSVHVSVRDRHHSHLEETRWSKTTGRFLSIGAAVISNRNERAPDGLVADAHLSDGFLHLILIKDCSHPLYLWHLTQLARKGGDPLSFEFVEHHKTSAFTFTSLGKESVWNVDGELFKAHKLSAQVFRGLVSLFASGPEV